MFKKLHNRQGFTLIEVLVSMIILAITSIALYITIEQGVVLMLEQDHRRIVYELAQRRMTAFKFLSDYHNPKYGRIVIRPGVTEGSEVIKHGGGEPDDEDLLALTAEYTVQIDESSEGDFVIVTVEYIWEERSNREQIVTFRDIYPYKSP